MLTSGKNSRLCPASALPGMVGRAHQEQKKSRILPPIAIVPLEKLLQLLKLSRYQDMCYTEVRKCENRTGRSGLNGLPKFQTRPDKPYGSAWLAETPLVFPASRAMNAGKLFYSFINKSRDLCKPHMKFFKKPLARKSRIGSLLYLLTQTHADERRATRFRLRHTACWSLYIAYFQVGY